MRCRMCGASGPQGESSDSVPGPICSLCTLQMSVLADWSESRSWDLNSQLFVDTQCVVASYSLCCCLILSVLLPHTQHLGLIALYSASWFDCLVLSILV